MGEEDERGFLVSRAPPDVRKANNRGNAEKQMPFASISIGSVAWSLRDGRLGGVREVGEGGILRSLGCRSGTYLPGAGGRPCTLPEGSKGRQEQSEES